MLITGASTGIGAAAASAFAREGSKVVVHYNSSRDAAEQVAADIKAGWAVPTNARARSCTWRPMRCQATSPGR